MRDCSQLILAFENLAASGFDIVNDCKSDRTIDLSVHYNCVGWAAGDDKQWWWPWDLGGYYWPPGLPKELPGTETLQNVINAFKTVRYSECTSGEIEEGFEKVALFANYRNKPTHAARSLSDGSWTSKLGEGEDIRHQTLLALEGRRYGKAVVFLRRKREKCATQNMLTKFRLFLSKLLERKRGKFSPIPRASPTAS